MTHDEQVERVADAIYNGIREFDGDIVFGGRRWAEAIASVAIAAMQPEPTLDDDVTALKAQVKWLRENAINHAFEMESRHNGVIPSDERALSIIGGIDHNLAVVADMAKWGKA